MLVGLRIKMFGVIEFLLCALERFLDGLFIDSRLSNRVFSQHMHPVTLDLRKSPAHCEEESFGTFRYAKFAMLNLCQQGNVPWQNTHFTFNRWNDDGIDSIRVDASVRSDDFKGEWHVVWV